MVGLKGSDLGAQPRTPRSLVLLQPRFPELVVAQRTVAAHIEHILVKLRTPTRTLAAVRAERTGLHVPCVQELTRGDAP